MQKSEWEAIAKALRDLRQKVEASWPPRGGAFTNAQDWHDRKLIHLSRLATVDEIAEMMCLVLKRRSSRFDSVRFLRMAGVMSAT